VSEGPAAEEPAAKKGKAIVLFSDGTGNSSAKLFKTNVWRMYEALDLGPAEKGKRPQVGFYDSGVGTSAFKPLAVLGGVFGYGLKRKVLDLYRYACRNYDDLGQKIGEDPNDGDEIYGFGFSRGAFTMRIVIAMIAKVGLVPSKNEADLDKRVKEAWRVYRFNFEPRSVFAPVNIWRRIVLGNRQARQEKYAALIAAERKKNYHPVIRFIGVWDTVSAYGGPIAEITEAIDNWIVRLSMPNYALADAVRCARHALAIDDERDSFHPLLWDELHEEERLKDPERPSWIDGKRLQQVWFTGMHADVGGGYPDESLSYVSFLWMMEEAFEAGLRPSPVMLQRFHALANSAGPLHDSRAGVASYYRYQPRRIAVWMEPLASELAARRTPELTQGLIRSVNVHESVVARIHHGTDRYAPLPLPANVTVVPAHRVSEQASPDVLKHWQQLGRELPPASLISEETRKRFEDPALNKARVAAMEHVWRRVGLRRYYYFASLALTAALVLMPVWGNAAWTPFVASHGQSLLGGLLASLAMVLPGFLTALLLSWADHPFYVLLLGGLLVLSNVRASRVERDLRDDTRVLWEDMLWADPPKAAANANGGSDAQANGAPASLPFSTWLRREWTWRISPFLFFLAMLLVAGWIALALISRASLAFLERDSARCPAVVSAPAPTLPATFSFETSAWCNPAGIPVVKGRRYLIEMRVGEPWRDARYPADPRGLLPADLGAVGYVAAPWRRAVRASYLQPVARIAGGVSGPVLQPLELARTGASLNLWRGEFVARRSGALSLFANDAVPLPWEPDRLYRNNRGSASVSVWEARQIGDTAPPGQHP
jgi:uncharacterized protein (DUF2235 family)